MKMVILRRKGAPTTVFSVALDRGIVFGEGEQHPVPEGMAADLLRDTPDDWEMLPDRREHEEVSHGE